jgi:glycine oxidase
MSRGAKVTVAGAGALGLTSALALADAGCSVTVCDPAETPQASGVAAGMLAPVFEAVLDDAPFDLLIAARNWWPALEARAGVRLDRSGTMAVGEAVWLAGVARGLARLGLRPTELSRTTIEGLAPGLAPAFDHALLVREEWRLEPRQALAALRRAAEAAGVQFRREAVSGVGEADVLVIATGADQRLAEVAPELAGLTPIRGQILRFPDVRGGGVSVRTDGAYAAPAADGLAIGATMEAGVSEARVDPTTLAPLAATVGRLYPGLARATSAASAGIRAATLDGLPLVGPSKAPQVILAVGARRNGWLLAPLVAQIVTACVTGRDPGPYAARLDPQRFKDGRFARA